MCRVWCSMRAPDGSSSVAHLLNLPREQVFVVPKGSQADPFLLETAREQRARIVTNDRYRDWAETYPEVHEPGFLVRGDWTGKTVSLRGLSPAAGGEKVGH